MTDKLPSICIVIPYFGKWPFWINYFLLSCRYNPTIDWVIYSDCGVLPSCPPNVKMIEMSFDDYCQLVSRKLAIQFKPTYPYKLCDIRPALGVIHADILRDYDFWGFSDIDLVYGDLRAFFTPLRLSQKEVFSNHATRISGHLCLIRNLPDLNKAYQKVIHWEAKFENQEHLAFDEKDFSRVFLRHKNSPQWVRAIACWVDPWLQRAEFVESYSTPNARIAWLDGKYIFPETWKWNEGVLTNDLNVGKSFAYFHFYVWKNNWSQRKDIAELSNKKAFFISKDGFGELDS